MYMFVDRRTRNFDCWAFAHESFCFHELVMKQTKKLRLISSKKATNTMRPRPTVRRCSPRKLFYTIAFHNSVNEQATTTARQTVLRIRFMLPETLPISKLKQTKCAQYSRASEGQKKISRHGNQKLRFFFKSWLIVNRERFCIGYGSPGTLSANGAQQSSTRWKHTKDV